ncbi:MAG: YbaN family protein [Clostridium sp.]
MKRIKKYGYVLVGLVSFFLGCIGVLLPILPTTPFLLVSSFCFARGSDRFNKWFLSTKLYKNNLESIVNRRGMTIKQKLSILIVADIMIAIPLIIIDILAMRVFLILLMIFKAFYFTFKIETIKNEK